MTALIETHGLGKSYGRTAALVDCDLDIPEGRIVGLVGPNGAGKTTLLELLSGDLRPSAGTVSVLGERPTSAPAHLARVSYVAHGAPTYARLTVRDHLHLGARLNPRWDDAAAEERVRTLGLDPARPAGVLSAGQRAQLALTMALARRPELVLLDEPVAQLDPLARRSFLQTLMQATADDGLGVVLSSHLMSDLERVCDYLILVVDGQVRLASDVETALATHRRLTGPRRERHRLPADQHVVSSRHTTRQTTLVVRTAGPVLDPAWQVSALTLEDLVLAYLEGDAPSAGAMRVQR